MKRRIFALLVLTLLSLVVLASCGGGSGDGGHEHQMQYHAAKDAVCNAEGNLEYWYCSDCGGYFNTSDGKDISYGELPTTGATGVHVYGEHAEESFLKTAATCSSKAVYNKSCVCGATDGTTFEYGEVSEHTYHEDWNRFNATHHYKDALCPHTELYIEGAHTFENGVCSVCLYEPQTEGIVYEKTPDGYAVKEYDGNATELIIPKTYKGEPVTAILDNAFGGHSEIVKVTIPNSVKTIGSYAFKGLGITSLTLPNSVTVIGEYCFENCKNLRDLTLSEALTAIPNGAFENVPLGEALVIPDSVKSLGHFAFRAPVTYAYNNSYSYSEIDSGLISVTIGSGLESINSEAIYDHYRISEFINLSDADFEFFYYPGSIVALHNGESKIEKDGDFWYITDESGEYYLINYTGNATHLTLPESYKGEKYTLNGGSLVSDHIYRVTFTEGVKRIKVGAFRGLSNLFTFEIAAPLDEDTIDEDTFVYNPYRLVEIINTYNTSGYNFSMESDQFYLDGLGMRLLSYHENAESRVRFVDDCAFITGDDGVNYFIGYVGDSDSYTLPDEYEGEGYVLNELSVRWNTEKITLSKNVTDVLDTFAYNPISAVYDETYSSSYIGTADNPYFWCLTIGSEATEIHPDTKLIGSRSNYGRDAYPTVNVNNSATLKLPTGAKIISEVLARKESASLTEYKNAVYFGTAENPYEVLVSYIESQDELFIHADTRIISPDVFYTGYSAYYISYSKVTFEGTAEDFLGIEFMNKNSHPYASNRANKDTLFIGETNFTEIAIPDTVTEIKPYAFYKYFGEEITIPASVASIEKYAFYYSKITALEIPSSVKTVGSYAFERSTLNSLKVCAEHIGYKAFYDTDLKTLTLGEGARTVAPHAFANCGDLYSVTIYPTVKRFDCYAFKDSMKTNSSVKSVNFMGEPSEWVEIFFGNCYSNPMHDSRTNFYYYLKSSSENYMRYELTSFTAIEQTKISDYAFMNIDTLVSVNLGGTVTYIGNNAFYNCTQLSSVSGMEAVRFIGRFAFYYCSPLTSITIPEGVTEIGAYAFRKCETLQEIVIPEGVIKIGNNAFESCYAIKTVSLPSSLKKIGQQAFYDCNSIQSFTVHESNSSYKAVDGVLFSKDGTTLIHYPAQKSDTSYTIPDGVATVSAYAFYYNFFLTELTVSADVEVILDYAICAIHNLTSLTFATGSKLTEIGQGAFVSNRLLEEITIPSSVTYIGLEAFYACDSLSKVTFGDTEGWSAYNEYNVVELSSSDLADPETAANYLTDSDYTYMNWTKGTQE